MARPKVTERLDIRAAVEFAAKQLGLEENKHFYLKTLQNNQCKQGSCSFPNSMGMCRVTFNPKADAVLTNIMHELIHCHQMQRGTYTYLRTEYKGSKRVQIVSWDGVEYTMTNGGYSNVDNYAKYRGQPWEQEAWDKSKEMYESDEFQNVLNIVNKLMKELKK